MKKEHEYKPVTDVAWGEIHRRLEAGQAALERGWTPTGEERERILKARAAALAREPEKRPAAGENLEVVEFLLAEERYAIETRYVREVYPLKALTALPGTPPFVLGIINARGQIVSVIDIKKFFDLPAKGLTDLNKVIILRADAMELGILADQILGVRSMSRRDIQPPLPTLTGIRQEYLKGVGRDRLVVLEAARLLSDRQIVVGPQTADKEENP